MSSDTPPNFGVKLARPDFGPAAELPWIDDIVRAQRPERLPVVLTIEEVRTVIARVTEPATLIVRLLYGSGLRLLEALMLRVKDVDFSRGQLTVRDPK